MREFSIIIPAYNAEETICRCLDSLIHQDLHDVQILVINDGSTDRTLERCQAYADVYDCIDLISQSNSGVSSARNLGLQNAKGKYILFIDSDDYTAPNYLNVIRSAVKEERPDLLLFGADLNSGEPYFSPEARMLTDASEISSVLAEYMKAGKLASLWMKAFKTDIIRQYQIQFPEELDIAEDLVFALGYAIHAKTVMAISDRLYVVSVENENSLSRKRRVDLHDRLHAASLALVDTIRNADGLSQPEREIYLEAVTWMFYRSVYSSAKELARHVNDRQQRLRELRRICGVFSRDAVRPRTLKGALVSVPIRCRMASVIDLMAIRGLRNH